MEIFLINIFLVLAILCCLPFLFFGLAKYDIFFTLLTSNEIKFIVQSDGSLDRIIHDVKGFWYNTETHEFEKNDPKEPKKTKTSLQKKSGLYWIGIPPFKRIYSFQIIKQREREGKTDDPNQWLSEEERETVTALRFTFPRPFVLLTAELKDRTTINMFVLCKFEVVKPYEPVFIFKGDFFRNAGAILQGAVIDIINEYGIEEFIGKSKGEVEGILSALKNHDGPFNRELIQQVGLRLVGITIAKYDPSDQEIVKAIRAKAFAEQQGQATVVKAEKDAEARRIEAMAERDAQLSLANGRSAFIRATISSLALPGSDPTAVTQSAAKVLASEAIASEKSKITTWVDGTTASVVVPPEKQ